jgi:hypothetical protein
MIALQRIRARFEVFIALTMKNDIFSDVAPCGSCKNLCFGGKYRLHYGGVKVSELIVSTLMMEAIGSYETSVLKRAT